MAGHLKSSKESNSNTSRTNTSPTIEELKKNIFIALEVLNGYTEEEALKNYECEQGTCQCP